MSKLSDVDSILLRPIKCKQMPLIFGALMSFRLITFNYLCIEHLGKIEQDSQLEVAHNIHK